MTRINESMSIHKILQEHPYLISAFKEVGLGKFEQNEVLEKLGPLLKLKTALASLQIDENKFLQRLNALVESHDGDDPIILADTPERQKELTLLALLPCGMKMPFARAFEEFVQQYNEKHDSSFKYLIEGNVNHEISYYPYIDSIKSADELPDILISSDINSFYHSWFQDEFVKKELFADVSLTSIHDDLRNTGFMDPKGQFTMLSANLLVIVAIEDAMKGRGYPLSWNDLRKGEYENSVVIRGDEGFFCNAVLLPFYEMSGMEAVKEMGRSVVQGLHPSEMIKMIDSKKEDVPALYVMPYFFARKIKHKERVRIIVPREGAIMSPVQMLVKKEAASSLKEITDFFCGKEFGQISADAFFPSTNAEVDNSSVNVERYYWFDWDFLYNNDIGKLKESVEKNFQDEFYATGGVV